MKENNTNIDQTTLKNHEILILHIPHLIHGEGILKRSSKRSKLDQEC